MKLTDREKVLIFTAVDILKINGVLRSDLEAVPVAIGMLKAFEELTDWTPEQWETSKSMIRMIMSKDLKPKILPGDLEI